MPSNTTARVTIDERRRLASGAATVFERAALARAQTTRQGTLAPAEQSAACLRAWMQLFSPGDPAAFERRLQWDGLDLSTVTHGLSVFPAPRPEPEWLRSVEQVVALAPGVADDLARGPLPEAGLFDSDEPPPFLELLVPALRASKRELEATVSLDPTLLPPATRALERQLLRDLAGLSSLAILDDFRSARATASEGYVAFTERMLRGGLLEFFLSYPVLAKQAALTMRQWVMTTVELVQRLEEDRSVITQECGGGAPLGRVRSLEPGLSDPHGGGRRVVALHFESDLQLIYKPRDVGLERAFGALVAWAASRGLEPRQRIITVIDRHEYGWVEFVEQEAFTSVDDVRRYYRQSGGLLCFAHVLRAKDLHMENVVATREGPVLIDLELMLQPVTPALASNRPNVGEQIASDGHDGDNCLTTSFLTFVEEGSGQVFDMGGLRGTGRGVTSLARRAWRALGSDAIDYVGEWTFETRVRNQVILDDQPQRPDDYADEVCRGFEDTYRFLVAHRDELLAPGGPLSGFSGCVSRMLPRATNQYALLRYLLVRPQYLRDGSRWSSALDALNRTFNRWQERPAVWPLIVAERQALEALDIPHFTVKTNETTICAAGKPVMDGGFVQTGIALVTERLSQLSADDLQVQLDHLARALHESVHTRFQTEPLLDQPDGEEQATEASLVAHATWIGRELLLRSEAGPYGRVWPARLGTSEAAARRHHLYDGSVGPAIFLAALSIASRDERWSAAAREALAPLAAAIDSGATEWDQDAIGAMSGIGSIVYGLTVVGTSLGEGDSFELATRVANRLAGEHIDSDTALDITRGAAGAMLGLLALYRVTGEPHLLAQAVRCGERLCNVKMSMPEGAAWPIADGRVFTGFAHGAAGIAYALGQLFDVTGDERFRLAAADGYRYVAARFLPGVANWPIGDASATAAGAGAPGALGALGSSGTSTTLGGGTTTMTAWCHGAPGIAMAIALGHAAVVDARLRDQLDHALNTTAAASPHRADHLCCGNFGRIEALFTVGRRIDRPEAIDAARQLAGHVIGRARKNGHFGLTSDPFAYRIWDQGLFRGLSGIGYALLRMAMPERLPSIIAIEAPTARG